MAADLGRILGGLTWLAAGLPRGAGPADPFQDFGPAWALAIALDVLNTVVVLVFLWRIWFEDRGQARPPAR